MSIAGFDPSAGAGLLADIKTFEAMGVYGMGACSALTVQNDETFDRVEWVASELILAQIKNLMTRFAFSHVKVGLIQNLTVLNEVVDYLKKENADLKIIWDPILQSSTGYRFRDSGSGIRDSGMEKILDKLYLMTPNLPEMAELGHGDPIDAANRFAEFCSILLKGGHAEGETVTDILFLRESRGPASSRLGEQAGPQTFPFAAPRIASAAKHGSGCVLSAAITARLSLGDSLPDACRKGGEYVRAFLASAPGLLGYHSRVPEEQHA